MLSAVKLPLSVDASRLDADLAIIDPGDYIPHFNKAYYEGEWSAVALRSTSGSASQIYPDPTKQDFLDTPVLSRCPYFKELLQTFQCRLLSARLLRLKAGSRVLEHRDLNLGYEDGEVRVHIPIMTSPDVDFIVGGERLELKPGECWYINFNLPHSVHNRSATDRIHLVIDCVLNDWLRGLFPAS